MKKLRLLTALFATLLLTGCNGGEQPGSNSGGASNPSGGDVSTSTPGPDSSQSALPEGADVIIYLDLSKIGLYEGKKGQDYPEVFLENAIKLETKVGQALPGADKVTCSTSGIKFKGWMHYDGDGAPTKYEKAPGYNNFVLLANFGA